MAEGFARHLGSELVDAESAGMMPLASVPPQTRQVMLEKGMPIDSQYPKGIEIFRNSEFDLVVNMSGIELPKGLKERERRWVVADPYGRSDGAFRQVRDDLEGRVRTLLMEIQDAKGKVPAPVPPRRRLFSFGKS